ncbi:MAG: BspA family leucine-rich repeat surface protein, partial [Prevotellaceae bacterium]|nr:BspA family leucine-rich repeat surface protein [Prevotellaceae bacterium]
MKKNNHFIAYMIAIMIMLFSVPVKAQTKTGYAEWDSTNKTLTFRGGDNVPEGAYSLNAEYGLPGWLDNSSCEKVVFDDSFKDVRPISCYKWFDNFTALQTIEGIENLNTENVTIMNSMLTNCENLDSLDLSSFNTKEVTDMTIMFADCKNLNTIYVSDKFTTDKVTTNSWGFIMHMNMFDGCTQLQG